MSIIIILVFCRHVWWIRLTNDGETVASLRWHILSIRRLYLLMMLPADKVYIAVGASSDRGYPELL